MHYTCIDLSFIHMNFFITNKYGLIVLDMVKKHYSEKGF